MKNIENLLSYTCYEYAPESFKLFFNNQEVNLSRDHAYKFGYISITKGKNELMQELKRFIRSKTNLSKDNDKSYLLAIPLLNSDKLVHINGRVKRYDTKEKLRIYKLLKNELIRTNYKMPIKVTSAKLDANMKAYSIKDETDIMKLANRVKLIS